MDHLILQVVLLSIAVSFCQLQSQDNHVVPPTFLNVSKNLDLQQLLLEWDVSDETYHSEKQMIFNIQINQTGASNIVWNENFTTTLDKLNRPIRWRWVSKERMECMSYAVRIRSLGARESEPVSESWSDWTKWTEVKGMDIEDSKSYIFPNDKVVEEGSNVSFCCIGKKGQMITTLFVGNICNYSASTSHRRVVFTVKNVCVSRPGGTVVACGIYGPWTTLFVTRPPGEPKNLSCETEDMETLKCSWQPGSEDKLAGRRSVQFILSDRSNGKVYYPEQSSNSCSFKIGTQTTYNLRLTARNDLGEKHTNLSFDVAHRVRPAPPFNLNAFDILSITIKLRWEMKPKLDLLCQIESRHPDGKVDLHNSTSHSTKSYYTVSGLQPYTKYTFRVRCGANQHFWKWSKWSESKTTQTEKSAPSGYLDVWRRIHPGVNSCNVTVFWKPFPGFRANGEIKTYEIIWEMLGEHRGSKEVPASHNSTVLFLNKCSGNITVLAKNSVDSSPPSVIVISAENGHTWDFNATKEDTINNTKAGIYISWKPRSPYDGYVIDWCNHPRVEPCDFQWNKFGRDQSSALITSDAFVPGVQYIFRVYGSLGNTATLLERKAKYLKELEPASVPELHIVTANSKLLKLTWDYDHLNESHPGFIRGYSVFVKVKDGNCTLEESEKFVFQDGLVVCKYAVKWPDEKKLRVNQPEPNKEYWIEVLAFSTSPPSITHDIIKGTTQIKNVFIPPDGNSVFQPLLLLTVIPLALLTCICFWKSDWVKNRCCPKIPHPHVTPIKVLQMYPKTLLAPNDFSPNNVIEEHKSQPWSREEKNYDDSQGLYAATSAVESVAFGNITYFTNGSDHYQSLLLQESERQKPELALASYKPLQCFALMTNPSSLNYVSQEDVRFPGVRQGNPAGTVNPVEPSDFKPQQALGSESSNPEASEEPIDILWRAIN
uniref:oncostatin-M-specific receptor subunit beta n=1 Tax=Euleptes europaea TaxID=460621 RepID=UPI00254020EF|nr:oncostatin-M-specific receptor subunit beta [Euleptes europaea]